MTGLRPWTLAAYLAAIFSAGAVSGWFVGTRAARSAVRTPPKMEEFSRSYRERLINKLTLTDDQRKEIDAILKRTSAEMESSHQQNLARILAARSNRNAQVVAILTPEQLAQYGELEKTYEQERRSRGTNSPWKGRWSGTNRGDHSHGDSPWGRRDRDRDWPRPGTNPPNPAAGERPPPPPPAGPPR